MVDTSDNIITDNSECPDRISIDFNTFKPRPSIADTLLFHNKYYSGHQFWSHGTSLKDTLATPTV